ncbi:MAG: hypothetical protein ACREJT_00690 [Myxococcota bacterium]
MHDYKGSPLRRPFIEASYSGRLRITIEVFKAIEKLIERGVK